MSVEIEVLGPLLFALGIPALPNFVPVGGSDVGGYDAGRLARLREIKSARDPRGVIRSNKPVNA